MFEASNTGGIDKLDVEIPFGMKMRREFSKAWNFKSYGAPIVKRRSDLYSETADLSPMGIPARLSMGHRHHKRLGPKLEIFEAGGLAYSDWICIAERIFQGDDGDVQDSTILRVDLTADIEEVSVPDFAGMLYAQYKQTTRTRHNGLIEEVRRKGSQTMYYGVRPHQSKIYNKTLHRLNDLLPKHNKARVKQGLSVESFQQVFGHSPDKIITRVERLCGDREATKRYGVKRLGNLYQLVDAEPFANLRFKADMPKKKDSRGMDPVTRIAVDSLIERNQREGLEATRAYLREIYSTGSRDAFYKFWGRYGHLIMEPSEQVSQQTLTECYRESLRKQLAA
jgi:hypothetical protein